VAANLDCVVVEPNLELVPDNFELEAEILELM
jgi:hypothetical protein